MLLRHYCKVDVFVLQIMNKMEKDESQESLIKNVCSNLFVNHLIISTQSDHFSMDNKYKVVQALVFKVNVRTLSHLV